MHNWIGSEGKHTPRCRHCGDPYATVDEHPAGLCPSCAETAKEAERIQLQERDADDRAAAAAFYGA